jgi:DNA repair protein RadC
MNIAEIKVSYSSKLKRQDLIKIQNSADAHKCFLHLWGDEVIEFYEEAYLLCLDRSNRVIGYRKIGQGGVSGCVVDPKIIFSIALACGASSIMIAHNHPSGQLKPSEADVTLTKKIKEAGRMLDINVLDHIIITSDGYMSFADEGQL